MSHTTHPRTNTVLSMLQAACLQGHHRLTGASAGVAQLAKRPPVDPEAITSFVARMTKLDAFGLCVGPTTHDRELLA
jgi:hypothetical protein